TDSFDRRWSVECHCGTTSRSVQTKAWKKFTEWAADEHGRAVPFFETVWTQVVSFDRLSSRLIKFGHLRAASLFKLYWVLRFPSPRSFGAFEARGLDSSKRAAVSVG